MGRPTILDYADDESNHTKGRKYHTLTGLFKCKNPLKYLGNPDNIVFRSSYELKLFKHLDENVNVIRWGSEEISIPYFDPVKKKVRSYYPDVFVELNNHEGVKRMLIEVKPLCEVIEPARKVSKNKVPTKRYIQESLTFVTNTAKWNAAIKFCERHGLVFKIFTEKELGIKK